MSSARYRVVAFGILLCSLLFGLEGAPAPDSFRFVLLGDRTGEPVAGVYQRIWRQIASEKPAFVVSVGDTIQGSKDAEADAQWREVQQMLAPYRHIPLYLTPGNHDIWSAASEQLFRKYAGHPLHYSFDYGPAHFTILDNSRSEELPAGEMQFLEQDLRAHSAQPLKFIVSHRPSWLVDAVLGNTAFALHRLARQYGVQYVIAGHVHQMLRVDLDGVTYVSLPSAGGHLRLSGRYEDGWFFGYTLAQVRGKTATFTIKEVDGRTTGPADWGITGLLKKAAAP